MIKIHGIREIRAGHAGGPLEETVRRYVKRTFTHPKVGISTKALLEFWDGYGEEQMGLDGLISAYVAHSVYLHGPEVGSEAVGVELNWSID